MKEAYQDIVFAVSIRSVVYNIIVFIVKVFLAIFTRSISILTDAVHSLSDLLTTIVVMVSVKISKKPSDKIHPFGHGRAEDIGGLILTIVLILVGVEFFKDSLFRCFSRPDVKISILSIIILASTALVKLWLWIITSRASRKISSDILNSDGMHHLSDVVTTIVIVLGLFLVRKGFVIVDALLGIIVSFIIIVWGVRTAKVFIDNLLGKRAPQSLYHKVKGIALANDLVKGVHGIEIHSYGYNRIISLHIEVDVSLTLQQAHACADEIEKKVLASHLGRCIVHVDLIKQGKQWG